MIIPIQGLGERKDLIRRRRLQEQEALLFRLKENGDLTDIGTYTPTESLLSKIPISYKLIHITTKSKYMQRMII